MRMRNVRRQAAILTGVAVGILSLTTLGHTHSGCANGGGGKSSSGGGSLFGWGSKVKVEKREQRLCPACGEYLGVRGSPVAVEVVRAKQASLLQKVFRNEPKGVNILACGPDCAAKVKTQPADYFLLVLQEGNRPGVPSSTPPPPTNATNYPLAVQPVGARGR